ncbi:hypothetical protein BS50DRAFT_682633 [Corynespora cassiicola Philippines]|uniref:NACHT domain-containing protein n=1 Tax=Corynespora cassiicola Philippines TaxID=1448308 RepID=A0A2T2N0H6_CORCC|nr:hypothetical protein BS50DRAFT_682633 [Corynespora cassiicola Philippines]
MNKTYFIIDTLDECVASDLPKLLDFIVKASAASSRVKWIVSSRNWIEIEKRLAKVEEGEQLSLELNKKSISAAVETFIKQKVFELSKDNAYDDETRDALQQYLLSNAGGTFLWVALVYENLKTVPKRHVIKVLETFPSGLNPLYKRMMQKISDTLDADICKEILAVAATTYRPTTLDELFTLTEPLEAISKDSVAMKEIISNCGSFLTLRENTVYFVHQSAKDFLSTEAYHDIFPHGRKKYHLDMFSTSLQVMSKALHRDMYGLREVGYPAERIQQPHPDPLASSQYSVIYWVDHLCDFF